MLFEVSLAQLIVCQTKIGLHFDRLTTLQYRFIVRMRKEKKFRQVSIDNERQWVQIFRLSHFVDRLVILAQEAQMPGIPVVSGCVAGIQLNRPLEFMARGVKIPVVTIQAESERGVGFSEPAV